MIDISGAYCLTWPDTSVTVTYTGNECSLLGYQTVALPLSTFEQLVAADQYPMALSVADGAELAWRIVLVWIVMWTARVLINALDLKVKSDQSD